jgi:hypothetical protein
MENSLMVEKCLLLKKSLMLSLVLGLVCLVIIVSAAFVWAADLSTPQTPITSGEGGQFVQ